MPDQTDPIQAQLIDARRAQILDAATVVFAQQGFHRATIKQIARTAGIADGTIYIYFKNKTDLLLGILNRLNESERRRADLAQSLDGDLRGFFKTYVRHRLTLLGENLAAFRAVLPDILSNAELRERYYDEVIGPSFALAEPMLEQLIAAGEIKPIDPTIVVRSITGSFLGMLMLRLLGDPTIEARWMDLPDLLTDLIFDGLANQGGD